MCIITYWGGERGEGAMQLIRKVWKRWTCVVYQTRWSFHLHPI